MGTSMSAVQIQLLWQLSNLPILCYDGDTAGVNAANRIIDIIFPILKPGYSMKFIFFPDGMDPDDFIKKRGKNEMDKLISNATPLIDIFWAHFITSSNFGTPEDRANIENQLNKMMDRIENAEVKKQYKLEIRDRLAAYWRSKSFESNRVFFKTTKKKPSAKLLQKFRSNSEEDGISWQNSIIILSLIRCPELVAEFMDEISLVELLDERVILLKESIFKFVIENKVKNEQSILLVKHLKDLGYAGLMETIERNTNEKIHISLLDDVNIKDAKVKFRNVLNELEKNRLANDLEAAKLSYFENATDMNESKIYELKKELDNLKNRESQGHKQEAHIEKKFDKWYEENKSRLERKD